MGILTLASRAPRDVWSVYPSQSLRAANWGLDSLGKVINTSKIHTLHYSTAMRLFNAYILDKCINPCDL
jgi:hypothetical protein